ncbi:MAG: metal-sensitive transcriptional regulator [Turneriella sp.]|nr:metal-sensitive transcriptional regulator [Turneriella sp.]
MNKAQLIHRLNRIQGQIEALKRIASSDNADCVKTIELAKAVVNATKKFAQAYVETHLEHCLQDKRPINEIQKELRKVVQSSFTF